MALHDPPFIDDDLSDWEIPSHSQVISYIDAAAIKKKDLEKASIVLIQDIDGQITIEKNRFGPSGNLDDTLDVINIACEIIVQHIFKGRMKLFRETMRERMVRSLSRRLRREIK